MKACHHLVAVLTLILAGCTTPGYVEQGGENRVHEVFLPGVGPAEAQTHVARNSPARLTLVEERRGTLVYLATAATISLGRLESWLRQRPTARTRRSRFAALQG